MTNTTRRDLFKACLASAVVSPLVSAVAAPLAFAGEKNPYRKAAAPQGLLSGGEVSKVSAKRIGVMALTLILLSRGITPIQPF